MESFWAAFGGGAAAGVVAILIELFRLWVGRDRLGVTVSTVLKNGSLSLEVTARNFGRRPIYLAHVAIQLADKSTVPYIKTMPYGQTTMWGDDLPAELLPGANGAYYFHLLEFHTNVVEKRGGEPPRAAVITDALDHKHSGRITPDQYEQWIKLAAKDGVAS